MANDIKRRLKILESSPHNILTRVSSDYSQLCLDEMRELERILTIKADGKCLSVEDASRFEALAAKVTSVSVPLPAADPVLEGSSDGE